MCFADVVAVATVVGTDERARSKQDNSVQLNHLAPLISVRPRFRSTPISTPISPISFNHFHLEPEF